VTPARLLAAYATAHDALLAERNADGFWVGELSSSALSTATAVIALHLADSSAYSAFIRGGLNWLITTQNPDGGWGDTTKSFSNISTSMLVRAAFAVTRTESHFEATVGNLEKFLTAKCGATPAERTEAIRNRYGTDRTFSVPILMTCALAGLVPWHEVTRLPFELACLPQSWYRFAGLPVVSYALPALIAIGQCVHAHRPTWNPVTGPLRWLSRNRSLKVLRRIQPSSGGYLEATPLTSFVVMALLVCPTRERGPAADVISNGVQFLTNSSRPDGSWPIDTNLSIWITTLAVNALAAANDLDSLPDKEKTLAWLLAQQTKERHPYTGAAPGGWGWSHCPGSVPDCDDTPGAVLAVTALDPKGDPTSYHRGVDWMMGLRNRDRGYPTFCRGWGKLPFDRSGSDLTAHAIRAIGAPNLEIIPSFGYLSQTQRSDGSWLPLWFGNQHTPNDENPVYGTSRVLSAYRDACLEDDPACLRGIEYLSSIQNPDSGWGGAKGCPSSVEETALAVEILIDLAPRDDAVARGLAWLVDAVESGRFRDPSPIGFYFAKLWYFEKLYPLVFTVAALGRATRVFRQSDRTT
jgi:squalene-hopene/tetraprenyl-beta-curcumene cyclase